MSFNSLDFLIFLPVVLILYWVLPHRVRWVLLLIASYFFYMSWNAWLVFLIAGTTLVSYLSAIFMEKTEKKRWKRLWFILTLVICIGALIFFKYFNFLIGSVIDFLNLFSMNLDGVVFDIILPIGISFYTFQTLSYVIDVYRGKYKAERHIGYYALFVSFFPQLVAGPIERPEHLIPQLKEKHRLNLDDMSAGLRMMISGFFRKCVIADFCAIYVDSVFSQLGDATSLAIFVAAALFLVQIYNDFAGYSEIAMGCARMMGIKLMQNFDRPFTATTYSEFFRRWHISLNQWLTDYIYIPLGGNRKGMVRRLLNVLIVFAVCGLWHGANWTYVLWGLTCGVYMCIENIFRKPWRRFKEKIHYHLNERFSKMIARTLIFLTLVFASVMFRSQSVSEIGTAFAGMFTRIGFGSDYFALTLDQLSMDGMQIAYMCLALLCMNLIYKFCYSEPPKKGDTFLPVDAATGRISKKALTNSLYMERVSAYLYGILLVALCWVCLLAGSGGSAFVYFQF